MRFFDEDNKRFEWTLATAVVLGAVYIGSFCAIRVEGSSEECSLDYVHFPTGVVRTVYRPLIIWDKQLNDRVLYSAEIDEVRFAMRHFCGE